MYTKIVKIQDINRQEIILEASQIIKNGGLVIFPTETVYGIGANALCAKSAQKIYAVKGRPSDNPLIVHVANKEDLAHLFVNISAKTKKIIDTFWPGPLTIIDKKTEQVPYKATGGLDTVAVRMPKNSIARALIEESGVPIAAPSANLSGKPSITSEEFIVEEFNHKVDMIILDDTSAIGIESTVIDLTTKRVTILRPGFITKNDLEECLKEEVCIDKHIKNPEEKPKSPGMKYKHYSPECEIYIVDGPIEKQRATIQKHLQADDALSIKSLVIGLEKYQSFFPSFLSLGKDDLEAMRNLFTILRRLDKKKIKKAYFLNMQDTPLEFSIMDRIEKAAGYKHI